MWGILAAAVLAYGLVRAAVAEPARKKWWERQRLAYLAGIPLEKLTPDQAADGAVLARRAGNRELERRFTGVGRRR